MHSCALFLWSVVGSLLSFAMSPGYGVFPLSQGLLLMCLLDTTQVETMARLRVATFECPADCRGGYAPALTTGVKRETQRLLEQRHAGWTLIL